MVSAYAVYFAYTNNAWDWFYLSLAMVFVFSHLNIGITLHRFLSHRSFKTYGWLENLLSFLTVYSSVGPTIIWVALHRLHHATADTPDDPHSPRRDGKFSWPAAVKVWAEYDWDFSKLDMRYVKDLIDKPVHRFIYAHYYKILLTTWAILIYIDPLIWVFAYCVPAAITTQMTGLSNIMGHGDGYRNFDTKDGSTNSWIYNIMTLGEGLHNNHHAYPNRWYTAVKWYEIDLLGRVIQLIKR